MSDKTREVYKDTAEVMPTLNPFVEPPRMRVSTINRINELIERDKAKPVIREENEYQEKGYTEKCPVCGEVLIERQNFCDICGQRLDRANFAL